MNVALLTVGDELLAGRTTNTNARWLCEQLTANGVTVSRVTTLPDDLGDIAQVANEYRAAYDAVIVTGGLGPTHDDVTMAGVAAAVGKPLVDHEDALEWLTAAGGYSREDLAEGTAALPQGARALYNEVGVAPGAVIDGIYVLPGVPREMKAMFETVAAEFTGTRKTRIEVVVDEPESALLDRLAELRERFAVRVGSYPGEVVRLSIQSEDEETAQAAAAWLSERVTLATENGR